MSSRNSKSLINDSKISLYFQESFHNIISLNVSTLRCNHSQVTYIVFIPLIQHDYIKISRLFKFNLYMKNTTYNCALTFSTQPLNRGVEKFSEMVMKSQNSNFKETIYVYSH